MSTTGYSYAASIGIACTAAMATRGTIILLSRETLPGLLVNTLGLRNVARHYQGFVGQRLRSSQPTILLN